MVRTGVDDAVDNDDDGVDEDDDDGVDEDDDDGVDEDDDGVDEDDNGVDEDVNPPSNCDLKPPNHGRREENVQDPSQYLRYWICLVFSYLCI
ncbi:hypothetical protein VNO77_41988 [Canavalia gladiata]|uniref:Uncharacterized protein n=1 Tax=Canavalia gladiata TaxID=3824 RepID=A0AAN9K1J2_CANGL